MSAAVVEGAETGFEVGGEGGTLGRWEQQVRRIFYRMRESQSIRTLMLPRHMPRSGFARKKKTGASHRLTCTLRWGHCVGYRV